LDVAAGKNPLRTVEVRLSMEFNDRGCNWGVLQRINGGPEVRVADDFTLAPSGPSGDTPWADVVVAQIIERAWETAYSLQLALPFP
jgi:hypothetical protein